MRATGGFAEQAAWSTQGRHRDCQVQPLGPAAGLAAAASPQPPAPSPRRRTPLTAPAPPPPRTRAHLKQVAGGGGVGLGKAVGRGLWRGGGGGHRPLARRGQPTRRALPGWYPRSFPPASPPSPPAAHQLLAIAAPLAGERRGAHGEEGDARGGGQRARQQRLACACRHTSHVTRHTSSVRGRARALDALPRTHAFKRTRRPKQQHASPRLQRSWGRRAWGGRAGAMHRQPSLHPRRTTFPVHNKPTRLPFPKWPCPARPAPPTRKVPVPAAPSPTPSPLPLPAPPHPQTARAAPAA
jgi:hypothetical protein